jgi:DNA-binding transcriptional MerR regulator
MSLNSNKDHKLFYSIKEVAEMFGVTDTLLRYWEKEFPNIAPKKGSRNVRQYTRENVEQIKLVYHLVKEKGLTLEGAKKALKGNKEGVAKNSELLERLKSIKAELLVIKKQLGNLT